MAALALGCGFRTGRLLGGPSPEASYEKTSAVPMAPTPPPARDMSIAASKPVDAYVLLGGRIKSCWFNADKPLLANYVYRANVSADGSNVQISIHDKLALGRAGSSTYAIAFIQQGSSTVVTTENRKMPPELAAKMQFDIDRWKRGETNCSNQMPPVAAAAPAPPPRR
jgi:hypothetical protein